MLTIDSVKRAPVCGSAFPILFIALAAASAAMIVGCESQEPEAGPTPTTSAAPATPEAPPDPQVLSLAPSDSAATGVRELILSWKPIPGIDRFVLCETVPPHGTECKEHVGVSEATLTVPGPSSDRQATGTWVKYLWLQACTERECSKPPGMKSSASTT